MKKMNPKTFRRLLLVAVVVALALGAAVAVFGVRTWQIERRASALRSTGIDAFARGDMPGTLDALGPYLKDHQSDREAVLAYAKARESTEEYNGRHLVEAFPIYRTALDLDPSDKATAARLLDIYVRIGYFPEARDLALRLRPAKIQSTTAADLETMRREIAARIALKQTDQTLEDLIRRVIELAPDDLPARLAYVSLLRNAGRNSELEAVVADAAAKSPDDPRTKFLRLIVAADTPDTEAGPRALDALCEIAGLDPLTAERRAPAAYTDPALVARLVGSFDALFRHSHALAVLKDAAARLPADTDLARAYARRAWQAGKHAELIAQFSSVDPAPGGTHTEVLAFKAMAHHSLGQTAEAAVLREALGVRSRDYRARAWVSMLSTLGGSGDKLASVRSLQDALREDRDEPTFAYYLGEALAALDRTEEAREQWESVTRSPLAQGWALPYSRNAATLLGEGRLDEAMKAAERGYRIAPTNAATNIALLTAQAALLEAGHALPTSAKDLLARVERAAAELSSGPDSARSRPLLDALLPGRVILMARSGRRDDATALIRSTLSAKPPAEPALLAQLGSLCAKEQLDLTYECLDAAIAGAPDDPGVSLSKAMVLHKDGRGAEALALLDAGRNNAAAPARVRWSTARARYLDVTSDPGAMAAWAELTEGNPDDLQVQLAALNSRAVSGDLKFVERLSDRVAQLSGSGSRPTVGGRMARARALVNAMTTPQIRDEASSLLKSVVAEAPDLLEAKRLLTHVLTADDPGRGIRPDLRGAIDQLRAIVALVPDKSGPTFQIAQLHLRQREFDRARIELQRILADPNAPAEIHGQAVDLMLGMRAYADVIGDLEARVAQAGDRAPVDLLIRAGLCNRGMRRTPESLALYRRAAGLAVQDPEQLLAIADGLAAGRDLDGAAEVIARVDTLPASEDVKLTTRARYLARRGESGKAAELFELAARAAPDKPASWSNLASHYLASREFDRARDAADRGLKRVPGDQELRLIIEQAAVASATDDSADLNRMIEVLSSAPGNAERVAAMQAVNQAKAAGTLGDPRVLSGLASQFSADVGVQLLVIRLYMEMSPPRLDLASDAARRALAVFPDSPAVARLGVAVFRATGDWGGMLSAANAWDQLSGTAESQLALAEAELRGDRPARAAELLRAPAEAAALDPERPLNASTLDLYARALIDAGKEPDAFNFLAPLTSPSAMVRGKVWPGIISTGVKSVAQADKWIAKARQSIAAESRDERLTLAAASLDAAGRFPAGSASILKAADEILTALADRADVTAGVLERLGVVKVRQNERAAAAAAFRRALTLNPASGVALSNLAAITIESGEDGADVLALAKAAAERAPQDPYPCVIAARVHVARADKAEHGRTDHLRAAQASLSEALSRNAAYPEALMRAADVADRLGDRAAAIGFYERVLRAPAITTELRASVQNNLAYALLKARSSEGDLERAAELARAATAAVQYPAYFDTLGAIFLARGMVSDAIIAFRQALKLDPSMASSQLGLAQGLARGEDAEKAEAIDLVRTLNRAVRGDPSVLDADQRRSLTDLVGVLGIAPE